MRRISYRKYLILGGALFVLLSVPLTLAERVRTRFVSVLSFGWRRIDRLHSHDEGRFEKLESENHLLRVEIGRLRAQLNQLAGEENPSKVVAAHVIYRDPGSWSSSLWIDVGEQTNVALGREVVSKNSPVVVGHAVVGAIDYVGKKQSRVRLITDVGLKPSVRAVRGAPQNAFFVEHVDALLRQLSRREDLPLTVQDRKRLYHDLETMKERLSEDLEGWYLAKGIVHGAGTPLWRSVNHTLRGVGFNYDFPDRHGPARELATGRALDDSVPPAPLLKVGDYLLTTGMDGIFPSGLFVGEVTKVFSLREGAYAYDLEAIPALGNLDTLETVFVIAPMGYDENDQEESIR